FGRRFLPRPQCVSETDGRVAHRPGFESWLVHLHNLLCFLANRSHGLIPGWIGFATSPGGKASRGGGARYYGLRDERFRNALTNPAMAVMSVAIAPISRTRLDPWCMSESPSSLKNLW